MSRILTFIDQSHWAMHPAAYTTMRAIIESWAGIPGSLPRLMSDERQAAITQAQHDQPSRTYSAPSSVAVLSMFGIIAPRVGMMDMSSEGCPLDMWCAKYKKAMSDPEISGVVVNVDSPGGSVHQVQECGDMIYSMRGQKPNVGVATGMAASAAYWVASQFSELAISPSAQVGSIGVLMHHADMSEQEKMMGVNHTFITSPRGGNKAEGHPYSPLSDETIEWYNSQSDIYYAAFLSALARGRGINAKKIAANWGSGRMMGSRQALTLGMVDRISPLQHEIDKMAVGMMKKRPSHMKSEQVAELVQFEQEAVVRIAQWEAVQETVMKAGEAGGFAEVLVTASQTEEGQEQIREQLGRQGAEEALRLAKAKLALQMEVM